MGLVKTSTVSINQIGDTITEIDTTGEDNLASSTKYSTGVTNLNRSKSNTLTEIIVTLPDGTVKTIVNNILIDNSVVTGISPSLPATTPLPIPNASFTKTINTALLNITSTQVFSTGVYKIEYISWYLIPCSGGGNSFEVNTSLSIIDPTNTSILTALRTGFVDTTLIKIIKTINTNIQQSNVVDTVADNYNLILNKPLQNLVSTDQIFIFAGYSTTLYLKVQTNLLACFQPKIAKSTISERSCCKTCKSSDIDGLTEILFGLFSVDASMSEGDYSNANNKLLTLEKICKSKNCGC